MPSTACLLSQLKVRPFNPMLIQLSCCMVQAGAAGSQAQKVSADLLLVMRLFTRLAQSTATIGQDVMRVKHVTSQIEDAEDGADALDLACQTADALCQAQNPDVELLGIHSCLQRSVLSLHCGLIMRSYGFTLRPAIVCSRLFATGRHHTLA